MSGYKIKQQQCVAQFNCLQAVEWCPSIPWAMVAPPANFSPVLLFSMMCWRDPPFEHPSLHWYLGCLEQLCFNTKHIWSSLNHFICCQYLFPTQECWYHMANHLLYSDGMEEKIRKAKVWEFMGWDKDSLLGLELKIWGLKQGNSMEFIITSHQQFSDYSLSSPNGVGKLPLGIWSCFLRLPVRIKIFLIAAF